jgi:hypothetical protein
MSKEVGMGAVAQTFIVRVWTDAEIPVEAGVVEAGVVDTGAVEAIGVEATTAEGWLRHGTPTGWRASVTSASGQEHRYFASPIALVAFLTGRAPPPDPPAAGAG